MNEKKYINKTIEESWNLPVQTGIRIQRVHDFFLVRVEEKENN